MAPEGIRTASNSCLGHGLRQDWTAVVGWSRLGLMRRIVILLEGHESRLQAKTATGVLRYCPGEVVAVYDSACAGKTAEEVLGVGGELPVVDSLEGLDANALLLGIAIAGGALPAPWYPVIRDAIARRYRVINGLHTFLNDDPELVRLATQHGARLDDLRRPPAGVTVSENAAKNSRSFRVHTVGHDCSIGKMFVALELTAALRSGGHDARFVATGQTGMMIADNGVAVDAVVSDFIAGAVEAEVLRDDDHDFLVIEGQGSLVHPQFSGVTLGLLHGCAPQAQVLCLDASRSAVRGHEVPFPPLWDLIALYERMGRVLFPTRVVGIAVNTSAFDEADALKIKQGLEQESGLPVTDVIRYGTEPLIEAILSERRRRQ